MKKFFRQQLFVWLAAIMAATAYLPSVAQSSPPPISVSAEAAALIDVESGRILWSKEGSKQMLIASTTKVLTTIVAIENGSLADEVTVGKNAYGVEGSSIYLQLGEKMSLQHLLYGLMLRSGNDAAVAIAEHVGGSIEGFAILMNQKAEEIGMQNSHFVNPHGLNAEGHYSTPEDMAKLAAYSLKNVAFQEIVKTKVIKVPNPNESWNYTWYNKNKMLSMYDGADGVKTGYTKMAGRCLVCSATREGRQLAVVTLNAPQDWQDHARLLDYGFEHFPLITVIEKGQDVAESGWVAGRTFQYPLTQDELKEVTQQLTPVAQHSIDYRFGQRGQLEFKLEGELIGSIPVYEANSERLQLPTSSPSFRFQESTVSANRSESKSFSQIFTDFLKELLVWST